MFKQQPSKNSQRNHNQTKLTIISSFCSQRKAYKKSINKILLLICLLGLSACSHESEQLTNVSTDVEKQLVSQAIIIADDKPTQLKQPGLAAFADKIAGVKVLALGEQTHGAGSVFALKVNLIKYLHQYHGFDLFILESGMYDVEKIYQQAKLGKSIKNLAPGNIFYMYANSAEVTPLFDYINEQTESDNPLMLVGFDSQHTGALSNQGLVTDLTNALKLTSDDWSESQAYAVFSNQIQQVLNGSTERFAVDKELVFFEQLDKLALNFSQHKKGFWQRISKGLIAQAERQWKIEDNRSQEMGENLKWWAEQYPDKKIIVWAHTWHLTRLGYEQINAGKVASDYFGDGYYMAHFTGQQGSYLDFIDMQNKALPELTDNSIEKIFKTNTTATINFIDIKALAQDEGILQTSEMVVFSNDYRQTLPAKSWSKYWDGVFVIKEITPAEYQP